MIIIIQTRLERASGAGGGGAWEMLATSPWHFLNFGQCVCMRLGVCVSALNS